jgi:hypothetical protein
MLAPGGVRTVAADRSKNGILPRRLALVLATSLNPGVPGNGKQRRGRRTIPEPSVDIAGFSA